MEDPAPLCVARKLVSRVPLRSLFNLAAVVGRDVPQEAQAIFGRYCACVYMHVTEYESLTVG